jgi:hypothetical protein
LGNLYEARFPKKKKKKKKVVFGGIAKNTINWLFFLELLKTIDTKRERYSRRASVHLEKPKGDETKKNKNTIQGDSPLEHGKET